MASRIRRRLALLATALIVLSAPAAATALAKDASRPSPEVRRLLGADTTLSDSGLYRVHPERGPSLLTHGPDPRPPLETGSVLGREMAGDVGFALGSVERAPVCATDNAQQILYAHPAGSANDLASERPRIRAAMRRTNAVLNAESLESGGTTADYRVRCDGAGEISVEGFVSSGPSFSQIVNSARAAGFDSQLVDYAVFYDGGAGGSCGIASYTSDETLSADNQNNSGGGYAAVYSACWNSEGPMHEIGHTMGAVQYGAPHSTGTGGHCWEEQDVMCYSPDGGDLHQGPPINNCPGGTPRFDCSFDDYFDSAPEPGEYLETHWNLGSPLNAFISFGGAAAPRSATSEPEPRWRMRVIRVRRHTRRLEISVRLGEDARLYLSRGHRPTERRYACRARPHGDRARCLIRNPGHGRWVAGILHPAGRASGAQLRITKRLAPRR